MADPTDDLVVQPDDGEWTQYEEGESTFQRKQLGALSAAEDIGCSRYDLPPGATTWHRHYHLANEEALYVLDGSGSVELGPEETVHDLEPGTFVTLPTDERSSHLIRAGDDGLRILMVSTMTDPDVLVYPDEEMLGVYAGSPPGGDEDERVIPTFYDMDSTRGYWEA